MVELQDRAAANRRRTFVLAGVFHVFVASIFSFLLLLTGAGVSAFAVGVVIAATWWIIAWLRADSVVLDLSDAEAADVVRHARYFNVTAGMCGAVGVAPPSLYVVDDQACNALAVGRDARHASLVVTQGLLDKLSLIETEAVISRLLYKVKSGDIAVETLVIPTFGAVGVLSEAAVDREWLSRLLAFPVPLIEKVLAKLHPALGEVDTDIAAVTTTRYPPALASALGKMDGHSALAVGARITAHLWIAPPLPPTIAPNLAKIHASLGDRVAVLNEL